jgi:hypothetical protein
VPSSPNALAVAAGIPGWPHCSIQLRCRSHNGQRVWLAPQDYDDSFGLVVSLSQGKILVNVWADFVCSYINGFFFAFVSRFHNLAELLPTLVHTFRSTSFLICRLIAKVLAKVTEATSQELELLIW